MRRSLASISLSTRIAVAAAATISAALASYAFVAERQQQRVLLETARRAAVSAAGGAANAAVHHLLIGDFAALDQLLLRLARNPEVARITVVTPAGAALGEAASPSSGAPPTVTGAPRAIPPPPGTAPVVGATEHEVVAWQPIVATSLLGWVRLEHRLDALRAAERAVALSAFVLAVVWSLAATVVLVALLRRPVVSIRLLSEFARGLGPHKGEVVGVPSASPEITQLAAALNAASRELRESEARLLAERQLLAVTLRSITDGVVATDRGGRVILANEAAEALFPAQSGGAVGRHFVELCPGSADGGGQADPVARVLEAGRPLHLGELTAAGPGGERRIALSGAPIVGGPGGVVLVLRDVTAQHEAEREHRRLQQAFEQAQKLESVGRLAGGIAHDFNNVLTVILGNVELALLNAGREHPLAEPLGEVRQAAESAAALTRQLLAFSRKSVIEPQVIDLDERLERLGKMLMRLIGEDVVLRLEPGRVGRVRVDPGQLEQILINLAVNARDAMPHGGHLTIRTARERLEAADPRLAHGAAPGSYAVLAVTDTGSGMPDAVKDHLFEPFFTTKETGKGTGLGLATVYGAVVQNHGIVEVESCVGRGSAFRVYLPSAEAGADRPALAAAPEPPPRGSETVLLVEDEAPVRRLATRALEAAGYRVLACAGGEEALAAARAERGPIHLVVTDVVMPGMDGAALVRTLAPLRPEARVLFVSGYAGKANEAIDALARQGATILSKPFTPATLSFTVRAVLDGAPRGHRAATA